ncbi:MAG TPA: carboxypeptidase-like regulatory domain-containing protein [Thermoanaerobaculia bacterium]|nr:carboxypeptidase-like regulatory domain-containing protein [Thermoanaerobaculia bacterium]
MTMRPALCAAFLLLSPAAVEAQPARVTFELVPAEAWVDGRPDLRRTLLEGWVSLYRVGAAEPEVTVPVGQAREVPDGEWLWIAESPGYVSTVTGTLKAGTGMERTLVWPVVPACHVTLSDDPGWWGVARFDVVSIEHGATFPVHPSSRRELWVPAGEVIAYGVGPRGLLGIDRLEGCRPSSRVEVPPPSPPGRDSQDLMVSAQPFEGTAEEGELRAFLTPSTRGELAPAVLPTARVVRGNRVSYFFLGVPADRDLELVLEHPTVRTRRVPVEALGGSARELEELELAARLDLEVEIDYRPIRAHREAVLEVLYCGDPEEPSFSWARCRRLDRSQPLRPGRQSYRFPALDDGQYVLDARIDDEVLGGLGQSITPFLDPESPVAPELPVIPLWEFEIYGYLLVEGDPVAGTIGFQPVGSETTRRFPTDDDLTYHLFYFGTLPFRWDELPDHGSREEMLGLRWGIPSACSADGYCRYYNLHSVFLGGGRLDWDLGSEHRIRLRVTDATTGEPVAGADVMIPVRRTAIRFDRGDVEEVRAAGAESTGTVTDAEGVARIRMPSGVPASFSVSKEGYRTVSVGDATAVLSGPGAEEPETLEVHLEPEAESHRAVRLVFPDGEPAAGAFVLAFDEDGRVDLRCSLSADGFGGWTARRGCEGVAEAFVFHPAAGLRPVSGSDLSLLAEVEIARRPERPLRVRLVDGAGAPLANVPVGLKIDGMLLDPNVLVAASSRGGAFLPVATDSRGVLTLRAADPDFPGGLELVIGAGEEAEVVDLSGLSPEDGMAVLTIGD